MEEEKNNINQPGINISNKISDQSPPQYQQDNNSQQPPILFYPTSTLSEMSSENENKNFEIVNINSLDKSGFKGSKIKFNEKLKYQDLWAALLYIAIFLVQIVMFIINLVKFSKGDFGSTNSSHSSTRPSFSNYDNYFSDYDEYSSPFTNPSKGTVPSSSSSYYGYDNNYFNYNLNDYFKVKRDESSVNSKFEDFTDEISGFGMAVLVITGLFSPILLTLLYIYLLQKFAKNIIKITLLSAISIYMLGGVVLGILLFPVGFIFLIVPFIMLVIYKWIEKKIPFTAIILETVASVIKKFKATIYTGFIGCFVAEIMYFFSLFNIIVCFVTFNFPLMLFMVFGFYYTDQVINNVVQVTIAGVFATFFFKSTYNPKTKEMQVDVKNPTVKSFKRAMTTSFGSICYGSLVIAIIKFIRYCVKQIENMLKECCCCLACCCCCFEWLLKIIDNLIQYFNVYAFTEVAIYGKSYIVAAKATWALVKSKGVDGILNDVIVGVVLGYGKFAIALLSGAIAGLATFLSGTDKIGYCIIAGLGAYIIAFFVFGVVSQVIQAGVITIFVCICEDADAIKYNKPELYNSIVNNYPSSRFGESDNLNQNIQFIQINQVVTNNQTIQTNQNLENNQIAKTNQIT